MYGTWRNSSYRTMVPAQTSAANCSKMTGRYFFLKSCGGKHKITSSKLRNTRRPPERFGKTKKLEQNKRLGKSSTWTSRNTPGNPGNKVILTPWATTKRNDTSLNKRVVITQKCANALACRPRVRARSPEKDSQYREYEPLLLGPAKLLSPRSLV